MRSLRIAYFSPMPPERSGISDYSVELLEHLTKLVEVDVFTGVSETAVYSDWALYPYGVYEVKAKRAPYQLNVYAMGNNYEFHDEIFDLALREPGLVVMHDLTLYGFYFQGLGVRRDLLADEVQYAHGARALAQWRPDADNYTRVDRLKFNLMRRIAARSRALISHSQWGCDLLREIAPGVPVYHVPLGMSVQPVQAVRARAALRIADDVFVAGVFGHIEPEKRVLQVIEAFSDLVKERPGARLLIAGRSANTGYRDQVRASVAKAHLERNVVFLGSPPLAEFEAYMQACDVVVSLRWPTSGESSAIMARAMGMGKLVITSDIPQFREFSDKFCWRVPYDTRTEHAHLVEALLRAATQPELLSKARQGALEYAHHEAEWSVVAHRYASIVEQVAARAPAADATDTVIVENPLRQVTGVNCIGDITAEVGLGTAARQMMRTILDEGIATSFIERQFPSPARDERALELVKGLPTAPIYPANLLFYNINDMHLLSNEELRRMSGGKYLIARWFWELSQLSDEWIKRFSRVDEVWVSSVFTQQAMQAITDKPITVIPATVEVPVSAGAVRAHFDLPEDRFIFIFTFAATSTAARKNPFAVIEAFEKAFGRPSGKGSPLLVIKAHHADDFPLLVDHLKDALARVGGILITKHYSRQKANDLLACADCYVSLHRAEGFGLGPAEAMYLGKPVIATNYSANVDFMTEENSYPVKYQERKIVADDHTYNEYGHLVYQVGMTWAEPDVRHAADLMRQVFEHPQEAAERGARAASDIRAMYSHEAVGRLIRKRLAEIERERPHMTKVLTGDDGTLAVTAKSWMNESLQLHSEAIASLEWSRTRDKAMPFGKVKGLGTLPRILGRVLLQGRINERQQWINSHAHQEIRTLSEELTALKQQAVSLSEQISVLKQQAASTGDEQQSLLAYLMRYGLTMGAVTDRAQELLRYPAIAWSENIDGRVSVRLSSLPQGQANPFTGPAGRKASRNTPQHIGTVWYHAAMSAIQEDRAEFFEQLHDRLNDNDAVVLLSNTEPSTLLDVGALHVVYDGLMPNSLRATVVRHPRFEKRPHALGYDVYVNADSYQGVVADQTAAALRDSIDTQWLRLHLQAGSVFVDIGAGSGQASIAAARIVGQSGKVISIEPDPVNVRLLELNKRLLPHPENWTVAHAAPREMNGNARLYRTLSDGGNYRLSAPVLLERAFEGVRPSVGIKIPARRMDDILAQVGHVDVVRLSMCGLDVAALRSMESILRRDRPLILADYWSSASMDSEAGRFEVREFLASVGYQFDILQQTRTTKMRTVERASSHDYPDIVGGGGSPHSRSAAEPAMGINVYASLPSNADSRPIPFITRALATIGSGPMASILDLTMPTFEAYARRHGYQLAVGDGTSEGRPAAWGKVALLRRLLNEYDEVLWIDADAVILDNSIDLATQVAPGSYQALARTLTNEGDVPNSGVWLLRGAKARHLLDAIWRSETYVQHKWWENAALIDLLGYSVTPPVKPLRTSEWLEGTHWLSPEWNAIPPWITLEHPRIRHYAGQSIEDRKLSIQRDLYQADLTFRIAYYPARTNGQAVEQYSAIPSSLIDANGQ